MNDSCTTGRVGCFGYSKTGLGDFALKTFTVPKAEVHEVHLFETRDTLLPYFSTDTENVYCFSRCFTFPTIDTKGRVRCREC